MAKFMKKPVEVEAWQLVEENIDKQTDYQINRTETKDLGIQIDNSSVKPYLWCEKSKVWVNCPYGTFIVREPDGDGFYPYHDAAAFLRGHDPV